MARTQGHGNPKWTRDETLLALHLYFECEGRIPLRHDSRVEELSLLLRRLPRSSTAQHNSSFRNAEGILFKLQNLRKVATGRGLSHVSQTDREVWDDFGRNADVVAGLAELIRASAVAAGSERLGPVSDNEIEFVEGGILTSLHLRRERSSSLRRRLLAAKRKVGPLACEMCSGGPACSDSSLHDACFETHHLVPLSVGPERPTRLRDLALICANCHRVLHRAISLQRRWLTIGEGRALLTCRQS